MQIDPRFPPRLSLSDTFWLRVANIFRFPKIFISLIRPSIWMMLILIVFSPITAPCAECLVGTIITRTIESHLPCFDKSTSSDTRQMAPAYLHLSLVMVDIPGPGTHGHQSGGHPVIRWWANGKYLVSTHSYALITLFETWDVNSRFCSSFKSAPQEVYFTEHCWHRGCRVMRTTRQYWHL